MNEVNTSVEFVTQWISDHPNDLDLLIMDVQYNGVDKSRENIQQQVTLAELCIQRKSVESLKLLLNAGCSTKGLIHKSIKEKQKACFNSLIEFGVDVDERNAEGKTPLICACEVNVFYYVRTLLDRNADPSLTDTGKRPNIPLAIACENGNIEIVRLLLEAHSPTASYDDAAVPLVNAVKKNYTQIVYLLIQYGADPNYHGMDTSSPFEIALENGNFEIIKILIASGAEIQKTEEMRLPNEVNEIIREWVDPDLPYIPNPNPYAEIDAKQKQLVQELQQQQGTITKFITESRGINFELNYMTPTLNLQNSMLVSFVKFAKKMDFFGKALFMKRVSILSQQYNALCETERQVMQKELDEDQAAFAEVLEKSKIIVGEYSDAFRQDAIPNLETLTAQLPKKREECLPKAKTIDSETKKLNRSHLVYLNQLLSIFNMNITEMYRLFDAFGVAFTDVLNASMKSLDCFRDALIEVRQISIDIVVDPNWAKESKVDNTCIEQCQKIQIDHAFLEWEEQRFNTMKEKLDRCLRQAIH